jgi:hypothetical protein
MLIRPIFVYRGVNCNKRGLFEVGQLGRAVKSRLAGPFCHYILDQLIGLRYITDCRNPLGHGVPPLDFQQERSLYYGTDGDL